MKKITAVLAAAVLVVAMASMVFAADMKKGSIKGVDTKAGTVVFCPEGTTAEMTLKADKAVDLSKVKVGDKVEVSVEKDMMKSMKPAAKPKAAVGC
jgi:Cu/Ag efflux protein CusF